MDDDEYERRRAEVVHSMQEASLSFSFQEISREARSAALDSVRSMAERLVGQPCLAQWAGTSIAITYPVINYRAITRSD